MSAFVVFSAFDEYNLETVGHRKLCKFRDYAITELAFATIRHPIDNEVVDKELREVRFRSVKSEQHATIHFYNKTEVKVRAIWLDFDGHEIAYSFINPGEKKCYRTYSTHPWIVREVKNGSRMIINDSEVIFASEEDVVAQIRAPPLLIWNELHHAHFPQAFQDQVRELLLCHKHLRKQVVSEVNAVRAKVLGDIPPDIIRCIIMHMAENSPTVQTLLKGINAAPDLMPVDLPTSVPVEEYNPPNLASDMSSDISMSSSSEDPSETQMFP